MIKINIDTPNKRYPFYLGNDLTKKLAHILFENNLDLSERSILIITDDTVALLYLDRIRSTLLARTSKVHVKILPAGENSKNLTNYQEVMETCIKHKLDRDSLLIGLGGGVIGDITGFVASTYMRGVKLLLIPTTIISHDSSIGGKNAINYCKALHYSIQKGPILFRMLQHNSRLS